VRCPEGVLPGGLSLVSHKGFLAQPASACPRGPGLTDQNRQAKDQGARERCGQRGRIVRNLSAISVVYSDGYRQSAAYHVLTKGNGHASQN
jgi:hypothetical protein